MADKGVASILWMIIWALLLIFVSWWIATFLAFFYIFIYIFVPCVPPIKALVDVLHRGLLLPYFCSDNFVNARDIVEGVNFIIEGSPSA